MAEWIWDDAPMNDFRTPELMKHCICQQRNDEMRHHWTCPVHGKCAGKPLPPPDTMEGVIARCNMVVKRCDELLEVGKA